MCVCLPDAFLDRIALVSLVSSSVGLEAAMSVQSQRRGEDDGDAEMGSLSPPKVKSRKWAPCQCGRTDGGPRSADSVAGARAGRGRSHHMTEQKGNSSSALTQSRSLPPSLPHSPVATTAVLGWVWMDRGMQCISRSAEILQTVKSGGYNGAAATADTI